MSETTSYENLHNDWIIHQDYLEYLHSENLFKQSIFRRCLVVLMCIPNDQQGNRIVLSLYTEKNKNFVRYLLLETGDRLNDRCRKLIEGKTGLFFMELVFQRNDKGEIFGARSVSERKIWIEKFDETMIKSRRLISDSHPTIRSNPINYTAFKDEETNGYLSPVQSPSNDCPLHRSCIEQLVIRGVKVMDNYEEIVDEQTNLSWEKIFYWNEKNDFGMILNNIGQTGTFLVRPQSRKTSSDDHDYTLCVYDDGHIYKYGIYRSSENQYRLKYREHEPHFPSICQLCQYYISHPLRATVREGLNKNIYLTIPYTQQNMYY